MSLDEIKKNLKSKELIIGTERSLKELKNGRLSKLFIANNTPKDLVEDIEHYTKVSELKVEKLDIPNDELGTVCKKPFSISIIGMLKTKKNY